MSIRQCVAGAAFATAILSAAPLPAAEIGYTDLYLFGDSLTDVGRAFSLTGGAVPPTPPYYMGQFTGPDGPVWADIVGDVFAAEGNEVRNYAVGGAQALGSDIIDMNAQIAQFGIDVAAGTVAPGDEALGGIWSGGNDISSAVGAGVGASVAVIIAQQAADAVTQATSALTTFGIDSFLFMTLGDLSEVPAIAGTPFAAAARAAGQAFDDRLESNVSDLRALGHDVTLVDVGALLAEARANPAAFGFTNTTDPCVVTSDPATVVRDCTLMPDGDATSYLWFDQTHPGSRAHAVIADAVLAEIAPIPLPAGLPLAASGLVILFALGRRKG